MHVGCGDVDIQSIAFRESFGFQAKLKPQCAITHVALLAHLQSPAQDSTTPPAPAVEAASPSHHTQRPQLVSLLLLPLVLSCFPGVAE